MKQDPPTATPEGVPITPLIDGLDFRRLPPIEDERGAVTEIFRLDWGFHPEPLPQVYHVQARPGSIRGWVMHQRQLDRIAMLSGTITWAFYDDREGSPTRGNLVVRTFSDLNRMLLSIPPGVWHASKNVGITDATFINMPNHAYAHDNPDKYRIPISTPLIPFDFSRPFRDT